MMLSLSHGRAMFVLDTIPYSRLTAYIHAFQASMISGTSAILGFSTLGASISTDSDQYAMSLLPFLPRRYVRKNKSTCPLPPSACRTILPVMISLDYIMKIITSGPTPLIVESVQNVSEQYSGYLQEYTHNLTYNPVKRDKFVSDFGLEGWREERLLGHWEAALFTAGVLTRWVVLVRK